MSPSDLAAVLSESLSERAFVRMMELDRVLVAGEFEGFVQFGAADYPEVASGSEDGAIRRIYVEVPGQGLGSDLLTAALAEMRQCERVFLDVWVRNLGAIRFYERFGFTVVGERRLMLASGPAEDPDLILVRERR